MKITILDNTPAKVALAGALGCMAQESSAEIIESPNLDKKMGPVFAESFGRGHGSVGDQVNFTFGMAGVSRLATLWLCQSTHVSHLQQSLRRAKAGEYIIPTLESGLTEDYRELMDESFDLYERMTKAGIPGEDARYILPLSTLTNIQTTVNARELCHYGTMLPAYPAPELKDVLSGMTQEACARGAADLLRDYGPNYNRMSFYPAPDLFAEKGPLDGRHYEAKVIRRGAPVGQGNLVPSPEDIKNMNMAQVGVLKHTHFSFELSMSLAALHQAIRQRTWDHTVQTLTSAAEESLAGVPGLDIVVPPSIEGSKFEMSYAGLHYCMLSLYRTILKETQSPAAAFYALPHSLAIRSLVHINGWNAIYSIGKRECDKAQWEIRGLATAMGRQIRKELPALSKYIGPQCKFYGECPEKVPCGKIAA